MGYSDPYLFNYKGDSTIDHPQIQKWFKLNTIIYPNKAVSSPMLTKSYQINLYKMPNNSTLTHTMYEVGLESETLAQTSDI